MSKKIISVILTFIIMASFTACRGGETGSGTAGDTTTSANTDTTSSGGASTGTSDFKIGIMTGTVSQGEEEYRQAENMKKKYGDMIVTTTYPDNFSKETETTIANCLSLAQDDAVKAIVFVQAIPGAAAALDKVKEIRPDMLFIFGVPGEDPTLVSSKADIILQVDEIGMGTAIIEQAKKQGAKTFVHYSFPRHMSYELLSKRRDIIKDVCAKEGIQYVDATAPDPTGDAGVPGAQQFILEDVPRKVAEYGKDTSFFSTNCSMQEPLIKSVVEQGAILSQQCCPSPYHGYPAALGIEIPDDKKGNLDFIISEITRVVKDKNQSGRMSTWPVPVNMLMIEAAVEYAKGYCEGTIKDKNDTKALQDIIAKTLENTAPGKKMTVTTYKDEKAGTELKNFYMLLSDYIDF